MRELPFVLDAFAALAWVVVTLDGVRGPQGERRVVAGGRQAPAVVRAGLLGAILAAGVLLERTTGRLPAPVAAQVAGVLLVVVGVWLHRRARRVLGTWWAAVPTVRAGQVVVDRGPYAVVRHPIYLAILLLAAGTVLIHPSLATLCAALGMDAGILLKVRAEERLLRASLGTAYADYAARVPALVPGLGRLSSGRP